MSEPPPPRYRVVERGRRLEVIDTRAAPVDPVPAPKLFPRQMRFDSSGEITTRAFYDTKGPRTIRLDSVSAATIGRVKIVALFALFAFIAAAVAVPWLLAIPFALFNKGVRKPARDGITRWLDGIVARGG